MENSLFYIELIQCLRAVTSILCWWDLFMVHENYSSYSFLTFSSNTEYRAIQGETYPICLASLWRDLLCGQAFYLITQA